MNKKTSKRSLPMIANRSKAIIAAVLTALVVVSGLSLGFGSATAALTQTTLNFDSFSLTGETVMIVDVGGQQSGIGSFSEGNTNDYLEGSCMPLVIAASHTVGSDANIDIELSYDYSNDGIVGIEDLELLTPNFDATDTSLAQDLGDFTYTGLSVTNSQYNYTNIDTVNSTVSVPSSSTSGKREIRYYTVTLEDVPTDTVVNVYLCARFSTNAGEYSNGSNMSVGLISGGLQNIPINPTNLIELPTLTIEKIVDGGSILPEDFGFTVTDSEGNETLHYPATGESTITITDIALDGDYTITELGFAGYEFASGTGDSCTFDVDGIATATLAAGRTPTDATCTFTNSALELPTITVVKDVTNDNGGVLEAEDFTLYLDGVEVTSGEVVEVEPGTYTVTEDAVDGYTLEGFDDACNGAGEVTVGYGDHFICTIMNNDDIVDEEPETKTLTITKFIEGDPAPHTVEDFSFTATMGEETQDFVSGETFELNVGTWNIVENENFANYVTTYGGNCYANGNVTLDTEDARDTECIITNTYTTPDEEPDPGYLTVVKEWVNIGDTDPQDLTDTFTFYYDEDVIEEGVQTEVEQGSYTISEETSLEDLFYETGFSSECEDGMIKIMEGNNKTCTITNTIIDQEPETGTLIVTKVIENFENGKLTEEQFYYTVNGEDHEWREQVSLELGDYTIVEKQTPGGIFISEHTITYGEGEEDACDSEGNISITAIGQTLYCTITNTYIDIVKEEQSITIITNVINDDDGTMIAADTTMELWMDVDDAPLPEGLTMRAIGEIIASFSGDESGVTTDVERGLYDVDASSHTDYTLSMSGDCEGEIGFEEELTCTVTYNDIAQSSGGGGGGSGSCPACTGEVPQDLTPTDDPTDTPDPIVLGDTDEQPAVDETPTPPAPEPIVLGATDELPRTGAPTLAVGFITLMSMALAGRRRK